MNGAGKGDKDRTTDRKRYREGYEAIDWRGKKCLPSPNGQHRSCFNEAFSFCLYCGKQLDEQNS